MSKREGGYLRVKARTQRAVNIISGKMQVEKQVPVSADDALWAMIMAFDPEAAKRAEDAETKKPRDDR